MKNLKIILLTFIGLTFYTCDLEEDPIFLDAEATYADLQVARGALDGIYQQLSSYMAMEQRIFVLNGFSGLFVTKKNGNNNNNVNNINLFSLKPTYDRDSQNMWQGMYAAIGRCNGAIANITTYDSPTEASELGFNDIAGQAYFVRAWSYLNLVRLWEDIPLWLELPDSDNLAKPKTLAKDVYAQIILDAQMAAGLINGNTGAGYPKQYAANMLLAKVYMTLATNPNLRADGISEAQYWQMAYDEAILAYGQYSLVADYSSLFTDEFENSTESIFELQLAQDAANSQMGRNFTPFKYKLGQHFGWLQVSADVLLDHMATYPDDPRIDGSYIYEYNRADNGNLIQHYPAITNRTPFTKGHPFLFKFVEKDTQHSNQFGDQNLIIYRYADLLLMLAEISNELQNDQQLGYVTEVLDRVGMSNDAYLGGQSSFRDAIMNEYRYELIGEGEDAHNNRRRGFDYFLTNTINKHNNNPIFSPNVDLTLSTDPNQVMKLPIPLTEINTNILIDD
ncbi:RagB/SusD family nutrient uptake outer membrane protein [Flavobacteriaceae bacterium]|nr:RagB/SusD family nutrient uptake outer membrane protein [Flavobacteriaceae bacterium]MDC1310599.1 RagB/SusD family nutrient uptake outer membrane protein [Flavobacteriaceae bacterium]